MLLKKFMILAIVAMIAVIAGCSQTGDQAKNAVVNPNLNPADTTEALLAYVGQESLEEMLDNYQAMVDSGVIEPLNETQKQAMIECFTVDRSKRQSVTMALSSTRVYAYTTHYVTHTDRDLYLEYKWYAGYSRGYGFETPIWSLYYAIKICYGGHILSWTWMEGGYQRVTAVVGSCVWVPFGSGFTQAYLYIVYS